ncbi:hypothetical protein P170DRAFT_410382 [Aspergillus steynii IBT 23096]|uniref:NTP binding protein n=1 Tax=Aspergillus steynii IBT 23096 TaxID=1392250 RepID=A0A2I2G506_9EURO|nr:uncharacterized protein P170DRAFT_410382 [Aspergillus steynii IBT 23096]PLB47958.1 hypothetical protein P170DRAFT_410382 [Aspergillus steynii IBT 23096]
MEERVPLPYGHLLNLKPRSRNPQHAKCEAEDLECERSNEPAAVYKAYKPRTEGKDPKSSPETSARKVTPTRLPMPKKSADKTRDESADGSPVPVAGRKEPRQHTLGRRAQPKMSPSSLERRPAKSTDKDREQYWRKVKEKFEKDSPISPRNLEKQKEYYHGAYQKIMSFTSSPKQEVSKHMPKSTAKTNDDDKTPRQSTIPRTANTSPSSRHTHKPEPASTSKPLGAKKGESNKRPPNVTGTSDTINRKPSEKQESTTDSSINSRPSISPLSGPSSSMTDWEDRFVVNMPSAKEPNPPTMSAQQISNFQKSIDQVHNQGETMLDPDTLPSPRTRTPEDTSQGEKPANLDGQDSGAAAPTGPGEPTSEPQPSHGRYYSPDEIGKQRFSTIWEEGASRHKAKTTVNIDGSFLGCKEINGPNDKNPDEILLFSTTDERPRVVDVSTPVSKNSRERKTTAPPPAISALEEKTVVQAEWEPISQNLKHAQCSKQSQRTMCRETTCRPSENAQMSAPTASGKENSTQIGIPPKNPERGKRHQGDDDVFIITPTITRTMMTMADMRGVAQKSPRMKEPSSRAAGEIITDTRAKPPVHSTPSGLRRATQNSWEKSNMPSTTLSKPGPVPNAPAVKEQAYPCQIAAEKPHAIRGYIHTKGIAKSSENANPRARIKRHSHAYQLPRSNENAPPVRSATDPAQFPKSVSAQRPVPPPKLNTNVRPERRIPLPSARIFEVAELDGHQVDDHLKDELKDQEVAPITPPAKDDPDASKSSSKSGPEPESDRDLMSSVTFGLIIDIFLLSIAQAQGLYRDIMANWNSRAVLVKIPLNCILNMIGHCLYVLRNFLTACAVYNSTGAWPKSNDKDVARSLTELGQAVIYLVALGFIMMVVGRAAGYIVLIGSWIVWVTKPFGWILGTLGRALLM